MRDFPARVSLIGEVGYNDISRWMQEAEELNNIVVQST